MPLFGRESSEGLKGCRGGRIGLTEHDRDQADDAEHDDGGDHDQVERWPDELQFLLVGETLQGREPLVLLVDRRDPLAKFRRRGGLDRADRFPLGAMKTFPFL